MAEFPGQFPGREIYNLDIRDENKLVQEARKQQILRQAELLNSVRLAAWADMASFTRKMNNLQRELNELEGKEVVDETIRDNWEDLKMKERG